MYWYHEKYTQSTFSMPKAIYNTNSICVKIRFEIETDDWTKDTLNIDSVLEYIDR